MPATFKIQVNKLSSTFIEDMKEKYGEAELEITVNTKPKFIPLKEEEFWNIIDLLDWQRPNDEDIIATAVQELSSFPVAHIYSFEDILSEKLYILDQQKFAEQIGENAFLPNKYFSVDAFLYTRACVVANGKDTYEQVLNNPKNMPKGISFEPLLSLASKAYIKKTGKTFFIRHHTITKHTLTKKPGQQNIFKCLIKKT
jgi:hypothetical protein